MYELLLLAITFALLIWHRRLSTRVATLEETVKSLRETIEATDRPASVQVSDTDAPTAAIEAPPTGMADDELSSAAPPSDASPEAGEQQAAIPASTPPLAARESFESRFGARWSVWVGGLALALGGIFLVRYSIDSGLLGPGTRLVLAALFGLLLAAGGEVLRRGFLPHLPQAYSNAMIPGMLTAAASVTLLATSYTAYGVYGFIGPSAAFLCLALISLATLALSLLHGQALAGLGLAASLATPALVSSDAPNIAFLFGFIGLVWLAANLAARIRRWTVLPILSNLGLAGWVIAYAANTDVVDPLPPGAALLVMIAGTAFLWPGRAFDDEASAAAPPASRWRRIGALLARMPRGIMLSVSLSAVVALLFIVGVDAAGPTHPVLISTAVIGTLSGLGAGRRAGAIPAICAAMAAVCATLLMAVLDLARPITLPIAGTEGPAGSLVAADPQTLGALALGAIFTLCSIVFLKRKQEEDPDLAALWAMLASAVPITLATITFFSYGTLGRDWLHGLYGLAIGLALLATCLRVSRTPPRAALARDLHLLGSFAAFTFALHALTNGLVTTLAVALLGFLYVVATRAQPWRGLPWVMIAAAIVVGARIAWEPTIVGPEALGKTPLFNALLAGYGIPTALLIASAWFLRAWPGRRALNALQGLAALAGLVTASVLVRHAMNGGVLDDRLPSLGEQSTYTLLLIGLSGILMTLDLKSPSRAFRYGSMLAGIVALIDTLFAHLMTLNPFFSTESIGTWPFINLLLPGYLLPAIGYAGLALYARGKRPAPYVTILALAGALLAFVWATLTVRWFWQGSNIGHWKGFLPGETYTYSVVWLLIGVGLLALGSRLNARTLRLASAGLVLIAVLKVFLIDMSNLEGILRALSFIGLGGVLIGIGLFYQRVLARSGGSSAPASTGETT